MTFNPPAAPAAPNTAQPATFQADADAFAAWMAAFGSAINGAGGLQTPGDFGLGGFTRLHSGELSHLDDATVTGIYNFNDATGGKPVSGFGTVMHISRYETAETLQELHYMNRDAIYVRRRGSGAGAAWSEWRPLLPQRGSGANGEYIRFADGTQICTHTVDYDATVATGYYDFTYPAVFQGIPACSMSFAATSPGANKSAIADMFVASKSGAWSVHHYQAAGSGPFKIYLTAIGRWE